MSWIHKYLSAEEIKNIESTIVRVETETCGEIVPVIVRRSSTIGHIPLTLTLLLILLLIILELPWSDWLWVQPWVWIWPVLVVTIYAISHFLVRFKWIQKIFVPERDEVDQVHQRAQLEFYKNRIHGTENSTGILLFVSVMEKKAVILADEGISKVLPKETWDEVLALLGSHLHKGSWGKGFVEAIELCGGLLKTHFPIQPGSQDELKNHLVIKD